MLKGETAQSSTQGVSPEKVSKMEEKNRKTGIDAVGDAPFGTHFCLFYETKEDLIDVLVPYFKAGLESNEFCMWVTSEPLSEEEAKEAMRRAVPNFDGYVERGQIEIVPYTEWYLKGGVFNFQRVLNGWVEKLNQALAKGYDGMRVTGNTAWLEKRDWRKFVDYEQEVNRVIGKYQMIALCTYSLDKCAASEILDVVRNHQFAVIKREDKWELIESSEIKRTEASLRETEEKYKELTESISDVFFAMDKDFRYTYWNKASEKLTGISAKDAVGKSLTEVFPDVKGTKIEQFYKEALRTQKPQSYLNKYQLGGKDYVFEINAYPTKTGLSVFAKDITERKQVEETLQKSEERFRQVSNNAQEWIWEVDSNGVYTYASSVVEKVLGYKPEEIVGKHFYDLFHPEEREELKKAAFQAFAKKSPFCNFLNRNVHKNGNTVWLSTSGVPIVDEKGSLLGYRGADTDITERKKMEAELKQERDKLEAVTENVGAGLTIISKDYRILWVNKVLRDIYGDVEGKVCHSTFHQRTHVCPECGVKEIFETGKNQVVHEQVVKDFDSQNVWLELTATPIRDKNGNITAALELAVPITERKKAEETLRESEEKYRNLFENARDVIVTLDLKGNVTSVNKAAAEYGFKEGEIIGKNMLKFVPKKYWPRLLKELAKATRGKPTEGEVEIITPKGKIIAEYKSNPIRRGKKVIGVQEILRDITQRKQMEDELRRYSEHLEELVDEKTGKLRESEERFRSIYAASPIGIELYDSDGRLLTVNKACLKIFGVSDVAAMKGLKLFEDPNVTDEIKKRLRKGEAVRYESPFDFEKVKEHKLYKTAKSGIIYLDVQMTPLCLKEKEALNGYLIHVRDITKRKRLEQQLLKTERLAAIGEAANMVGHDLRNPLQAIDNATYYLKNECARMPSSAIPPKAKEILQVIEDSVNYADKIVRDLSDFSATKKPSLKRIDINMLVKETLSQAEAPRNVEISTELSQRLEIEVDEDQMKRVFLNLIANGIQAMENGGTLTVSTRKAEGFVEISFKDTGVGIPQDNMDKMFSPFFTTKAKGMGVGLAICKKIVESHDGTIHLESEVGKGTTFTVKLPIRHETEVENVARE